MLIFDTFPWPQAATVKQIDAMAIAAREVRRVRDEALRSINGGLRALYLILELPGANPLKDAHAAVLAAYGFSAKKDLLAQILALNLEVAAKLEKGETVTAPGVPKNYPNVDKLVTEDCIRAPGERPKRAKPDGSTAQSYGDAAHYYAIKEEPPKYGE